MAEELAQEVFLRVYKAAPRYQPNARFSTWIFKIATNVCLNEVRKQKYKVNIKSVDASLHTDRNNSPTEIEDTVMPPPHNLLEKKERDKLIQDALSSLPDKQRAALLLRIYQGFTYQEIGIQLKKSEKGVKSLIHRGRQNLKDALEGIL